MYRYMSVSLSKENQIEEINDYAMQGWRLISVMILGWNTIAYFEKPL